MSSKSPTVLLARILDSGLGGSQTGDGHAEGRAADIVQANLVAELDTAGVAAMFAADAQTQVGVGSAAVLGSHLDQAADAGLIQVLERIALDRKSVV